MSGRPRNPQIPSRRSNCPTCGRRTEHRRHRKGYRSDGTVRYQWRCVPCVAARELARYHSRRQEAA